MTTESVRRRLGKRVAASTAIDAAASADAKKKVRKTSGETMDDGASTPPAAQRAEGPIGSYPQSTATTTKRIAPPAAQKAFGKKVKESRNSSPPAADTAGARNASSSTTAASTRPVVVSAATTSPAEDVEPTTKKRRKRRPWRQAVRNHARAQRKGSLGSSFANGDGACSSANGGENSHAKAKSTSKNKRRKERRRKLRDGVANGTEDAGEKSDDEAQVADHPANRLDASRFRFINEKLYTTTSMAAKRMFDEDREAFDAYHRGYRLQTKSWPIKPVDKLIRDLSTLPAGSVIADVGCGEAKIASKLSGDRLIVHSFDLVAANERVTPADMARLPLAAASVDVAVYCLSLMGTNLSRFIREANRILKIGGKLKICEVFSRFHSVANFVVAIEKMGFELKCKKNLQGYFLLMSFTKIGSPKDRRPLGLVLHPCLYKKR